MSAPSSHYSELSRHLLSAQEDERKRISRELHDETGQSLMLLRLYFGMLAGEAEKPESQLKIQEATELLDRTIGGLRRIIRRLSPRVLEELGLLAAIRKEGRELSKNTGMKVQFDLPDGIGHLEHEVEFVIYRCVQEALHNIAKHSQARKFSIRLEKQEHMISFSIEDDGIGFAKRGNTRKGSFGLSGMRERVAALGGTLRILSRSSNGVRLRVTLPTVHGDTFGRRQAHMETGASIKRAVVGRAS